MAELETLDRLLKEKERLQLYVDLLKSGKKEDIEKCISLIETSIKNIDQAISVK